MRGGEGGEEGELALKSTFTAAAAAAAAAVVVDGWEEVEQVVLTAFLGRRSVLSHSIKARQKKSKNNVQEDIFVVST